MNAINSSADEGVECPLCMEPLEVDDLNFYPCTCGYQICRFCWHRIRTDENELCPACRKAYPENPADFTPLSQEQISALKAEKRQRDQQRKQKITENRKHLANVRVVQKNLVFVVGLPPRLADADILKKYEYFGKYGKIHKVVINPSTTYAGVQGPSASAYVTYVNNNDALRAIQSVNNIMIDGRLIKTSLGTTKYCSHFMKNQQCPKSDCMYLHELGDSEASFTKEEMHQGKHQEYEKRLHDTLIASTVAGGNGTSVPGTVTPTNTIGNGNIINGSVGGNVQSKEAWPSLSTSPVNNKEQLLTKSSSNGKNGNKDNNGKKHHDKTKSTSDKKSQKQQKSNLNHTNNNKNDNNHNKENNNGITNQNLKDSITNLPSSAIDIALTTDKNNKTDKNNHHTQKDKLNHNNNNNSILDDEINLIEDLEKSTTLSEDNDGKRSLSSSSSSSSSSSVSSSVSTSSNSSNNGDSGSLSDSTNSFPEHLSSHQQTTDTHNIKINVDNDITQTNGIIDNGKDSINRLHQQQTNDTNNLIDTSACLSKLSLFDDNNSFFSSSSFQPLLKGKLDNDSRALMNNQLNSAISSHLPDLLNEIFSQKGIDAYQGQTTNSITNGLSTTTDGSSLSNSSMIDNPEKYLLSLNTTEDWEAAFKYVMLRNNKQMEVDQQQQDELLRMQEMQKRNNLVNSIGMPPLNGLHDFNSNNDFGSSELNRISQQTAMFHQQQQQQQQQQQRQPNNMHHNDHMLGGQGGSSIFGTNMSKFFDFHKSQQQHSNHHHFMSNGLNNNGLGNDHRDHLSMATLLENNRVNSNYLEHSNGLGGQPQQQQLQKQRLLNKYDQLGVGTHNNHMMLNSSNQPQQQQQQQQQPPTPQQQNRIPNQFTQSSTVDDDLGFDPFIETQKALAELMENEMVQQPQPPNNINKHLLDNCQRARMPPPGFNHMNAFGFGIPRPQGSKILPFMNMTNNPGNPNNGGIPPPTNAQQPNNWTQHMNFQQPPPPPNQINEQQLHMGGQQNNNSKSNYGNMSDWTAMDPAILSFRQFPSFSSHQQQQQQHPQQQQQQQQQQQPPHNAPDMFMQHLSQQNLPQSGQGFGHHGINLQNNLLNSQNSQAQVNYGHSNWLNNDQSLFMNNLGNGYTNNNYDNKFSIPMPPGIHSNNMNCMSGNKQQKTECIN